MSELNAGVLVDQANIQRVLNRYATSLDSRQWAGLDEVFTADASAHYGVIGHFNGRVAIAGLVAHVLNQCGPTQHLLGNYDIEVVGDNATATCYLQAIHAGIGDFQGKIMTVWGQYRDKLIRTADGWRIVQRELVSIHSDGDIGIK